MEETYSDSGDVISTSEQNNTSEQDVVDLTGSVVRDNLPKKKRSIVHSHFTFNEQENEYCCNHCR